jgi:BON domain
MKQSDITKLALALVLATLVTACGKTVGDAIDDTTITTRVKTAMLNDPGVGGLRIDVDTFKGVVTLSGRVKSLAEKEQAVTLARRVSGVAEVKDALQIIPETPAPNPPAPNSPTTQNQ